MEGVKIVTWNVRGINNNIARRNLGEVKRATKADIICIQESKCDSWEISMRRFPNLGENCGVAEQPSVGNSGGLATIWNQEAIKCIALAQNRYWIWTTFTHAQSKGNFHVINVYSPVLLNLKRLLWNEIRDIVSFVKDEEGIIVGDFNSIRSIQESWRCNYHRRDMEDFDGLIQECNLSDLRPENACFTWFGPSGKRSRLDRVLVNERWSQIANWKIKALCRMHSDHRPLLLFAEPIVHTPKPFKVFNCYLTDKLMEEVKKRIREEGVWSQLNIQQVLKEIKGIIKADARGGKGKLEEEIKMLEKRLSDSDNNLEDDNTLLEVQNKLRKLYESRDSMLCQKARMNWLKLGDGNTRFFHQAIQKRKTRNNIRKLLWENKWITSLADIQQAFLKHYSNFFRSSGSSFLELGSLSLPRLTSQDNSNMVRGISKQEIEAALCNMAEDKAPGPDGLNVRSLKFLWPLIGSKVELFISNFFKSGIIPPGLNSSFITLIPKVTEPKTIMDFRPISLINTTFKILTKILATRIASHMQYLISDCQTGFIKGRQASESILMVKEIAHSLQKENKKGLILKLDFEKAFDTVNWEFLMATMRRMNFAEEWIKWIKAILESARVSILVNGAPTREFSPGRGLRQGDPLSPLLYNLVGEVLSSMLKEAACNGIFRGIQMKNTAQQLTHLQFADDTIIFVEDSVESIEGVKKVLQCFQLISGLKINFEKSEILAHKTCRETQLKGAKVLGCQIGSWPMKYLGVPIGFSCKRKVFWEPLVKNFKRKLAQWKAESLNQAGRLILVKAVMDNLPIYWLNLHKIPTSVCERLERIRRDFIWGHINAKDNTRRKLHLTKWGNICKPKEQGGLGLVPIRVKNQALLGKWSYRWEKERHRKWNIWIRDKYSCTNSDSMGEGLKDKKMSDSLEAMALAAEQSIFTQSVRERKYIWKVGNGQQVLFWEDCWLEDMPLMQRFKKLYNLSNLKELTIESFVQLWRSPASLEVYAWSRPLREWEKEERNKLEQIIVKIKLSSAEDTLIWKVSRGNFSVKQATLALMPSSEKLQWTFIWKLKVPNKIKLFQWKVHMNILPTKKFLSERGLVLQDRSSCIFCNKHEETVYHILQECQFTTSLWGMVCTWWQIQHNVLNLSSLESLWESAKFFSLKKARTTWKVVVSATMWVIWLARNNAIFDQKEQNSAGVLARVKQQSKDWCVAMGLILEESACWWSLNPMGTLTHSAAKQKQDLLKVEHELIGFVDGSWKIRKGLIEAGIGGAMQKPNGNSIYTFSGPCHASNAFEAEWSAICYLLRNFLKSRWVKCSLIIYTDSKSVWKKFLELYSGSYQGEFGDFVKLVRSKEIKVQHIPRDLNVLADSLAKSGARKSNMAFFWA